MRKVAVNTDGQLLSREKSYFGGEFSLIEKFLKLGIGSPRVIYLSGVETFDKLNRNIEGEITFVNFELLKEGLIIRANRNQRIACIGERFEAIDEILLYGMGTVITSNYLDTEKELLYKADLKIISNNDVHLNCTIASERADDLLAFFYRKEFKNKFVFLDFKE